MKTSKRTKKLGEDKKYIVIKKGSTIITINKETGEQLSIDIVKKKKRR